MDKFTVAQEQKTKEEKIKSKEEIREEIKKEIEKMSSREILRKQIEVLALNSQQRTNIQGLTDIANATECIRKTYKLIVLADLGAKVISGITKLFKLPMNIIVFIKKLFRR